MKILGRTQVYLFFASIVMAFVLSGCGGDQQGSSNMGYPFSSIISHYGNFTDFGGRWAIWR
ncbi:hypothetical protein R69746_08347 [Paraburkholderia aspalathi]|uniref:hypothetical protein n=1 Tax=Paraburkholderia aspalathi TaxID=1324617 RepID=UPI0019096253|nr:hypothetical protein [Paraburkholderia aspalathi]MBK3844253.1 hypothetical protein [Paraburkholderia aspalathi]CAE6870022.1 hypothetical protein R69746_08347 [Paraburkholderia aspalathi]